MRKYKIIGSPSSSVKRNGRPSLGNGSTRHSKEEVVHVNDERINAVLAKGLRVENRLKDIGKVVP